MQSTSLALWCIFWGFGFSSLSFPVHIPTNPDGLYRLRHIYQCRTHGQYVTAKAFYPLLLALCYRASSAYIIAPLKRGVGHSWGNCCSLNAHPLRSTVSSDFLDYLGINLSTIKQFINANKTISAVSAVNIGII